MPLVNAGLVTAIANAHLSKSGQLGKFPKPTTETILAAEILKLSLGRAYIGKFAVSVTEMGSDVSNAILFVVAVSGYHPALSFNRQTAATTLNQELQDHASPFAGRAGYVFTQPLDAVYHPMHQTTADFFRKAFGKSYDVVTFADASPKFTEFRTKINLTAALAGVNRPKPVLGGNVPPGTLLSSLTSALQTGDPKASLLAAKQRPPVVTGAPVFAAALQLKGLAKASLLTITATALAVRMDLFSPGDLPPAIRAVRSLTNDLAFVAKMQDPPPEVKLLALFGKFLRDILDAHKNNGVAEVEQPHPELVAQEIVWTAVPNEDTDKNAKMVNDTAKMIQGIAKEAITAWGANALGRYCAEPKGYFYARNALVWSTRVPVYVSGKPSPMGWVAEPNQFAILRGQLAFWYNATTEANFNKNLLVHDGASMPGAGTVPAHGSYMLPCSSCAERSGLMTLGMQHSGGTPVPQVFPWMQATEKEIYDYLQSRFSRQLDHTATQVLVGTAIEHRGKVALKQATPDFETAIRDRARRMAIIL